MHVLCRFIGLLFVNYKRSVVSVLTSNCLGHRRFGVLRVDIARVIIIAVFFARDRACYMLLHVRMSHGCINRKRPVEVRIMQFFTHNSPISLLLRDKLYPEILTAFQIEWSNKGGVGKQNAFYAVISQKRYEMRLKLLFITNKKLYVRLYRLKDVLGFYRAILSLRRARYCYGKSSVRLSVCLSVTLRYRDHMGWKSSKIISRLVRLGCALSVDPNIPDLLQRKRTKILTRTPEVTQPC